MNETFEDLAACAIDEDFDQVSYSDILRVMRG